MMSPTLQRLQKLPRVRHFNRNLQAATQCIAPPQAKKPEAPSNQAEDPPLKAAANQAIRTEADTADNPMARQDPYEENVAWYMGKRIYPRRHTQVSRLFCLLARPVGQS